MQRKTVIHLSLSNNKKNLPKSREKSRKSILRFIYFNLLNGKIEERKTTSN